MDNAKYQIKMTRKTREYIRDVRHGIWVLWPWLADLIVVGIMIYVIM